MSTCHITGACSKARQSRAADAGALCVNKILLKPPLIFFILVMFTSSINAIEEQACIDPLLVAISGLLPGMDKKLLLSVDKYNTKETTTGEDDGGVYEAHIYHYAKYDITVVRGVIDSILITSPDLLWAQKIKIGTDRKTVEKHLILNPVVNEAESSQYVVCSSVGDVYAILQYYKNEIKNIELVIDRP